MKKKQRIFVGSLMAVLLLALATGLTWAQGPAPQSDTGVQVAVSTAFTYQGRLTDGGNPANGTYDFRFKLYDAQTGGSQVGSTVTANDVTVTDGLFTVQLDFGNVFDGTALWLEIGVRPGDSTGSYTTLNPRQALTAAPFAMSLMPGAKIAANSSTTQPTLRLHETAADYARLEFANTNTARKWHIAGYIGANQADDRLNFWNNAAGNVMSLTGDGKVGIQTAAPEVPLHVVGGMDTEPGSGGYLQIGNTSGANLSIDNNEIMARNNGKPSTLYLNIDGGDVSISPDDPSGKLGVGTNAPQTRLHVVGAIDGVASLENHVAIIENNASTTDNGPDVLALKTSIISNPGTNTNFITFFKGDYVALGAVEGNGSGGVNYKSGGADYAEWLPLRNLAENIQPGDIVAWTPQGITRRTTDALRLVVVSSNPLATGNAPMDEAQYSQGRAVAFVGQVPVRVRGPVQAGDFILPSGRHDGTGVAISPGELRADHIGQVVGRALENAAGPGVHKVKVLVGLPQNAILQAMLTQRDARLAALEARLEALERGRGWVRLPYAAPWLGLGLLAGLVLAQRRKEGER
ncbi:MAG: hypothetical protein D6802_03630 [Ardenticatenia bacterium]|nr:MAG: hypothetical protein D6802_03630 [Ardenticatenia bacterium]